ncbi:hypothetical protein [Pseudenhygromyxa sp. WMMC2535]|uniref:hypothetical protein n=1 Tax=Pseudenhygromyxa sp. WMMC2535 TaxID=2712867 RepID=UPI0020D13126|nr:hypothetical protein [Pseudenhygromyxa sp. WMMC2535]
MDGRLAALELDLEGASAGRQARKAARSRKLRPAGEEWVLHHGQARLQWLVSAT